MTRVRGAVALPVEALDRMMPLHLRVGADGRITGYGPTLTKLLAGQSLVGRDLFEAFEVRRPAGVTDMAGLRALAGEKLRLSPRGTGRLLSFRGLAVGLADGGGMVLNLSFGIGVIDAVRTYALTDGDFAPTDLAVEMMYLVEAKTAAMEALRGLAHRLQGDKQTAEAQALTDTLTGLGNRRALQLALDRLSTAAVPFGLMHIDLDFFKAVNDRLGHAAGDHVLQRVAAVLRDETGPQDSVTRVGGDEFVVVLPNLTDRSRLDQTARRIIEALNRPISFEGETCRISASIGITTSAQYDRPRPDQMQLDADEALYASKRAGRGRALFHGSQDRRRA